MDKLGTITDFLAVMGAIGAVFIILGVIEKVAKWHAKFKHDEHHWRDCPRHHFHPQPDYRDYKNYADRQARWRMKT